MYLSDNDIKEMKARIDELFEYEIALTDDPEEMEALVLFNTEAARLSNIYSNKLGEIKSSL